MEQMMAEPLPQSPYTQGTRLPVRKAAPADLLPPHIPTEDQLDAAENARRASADIRRTEWLMFTVYGLITLGLVFGAAWVVNHIPFLRTFFAG